MMRCGTSVLIGSRAKTGTQETITPCYLTGLVLSVWVRTVLFLPDVC